jgi:hypothetical protein
MLQMQHKKAGNGLPDGSSLRRGRNPALRHRLSHFKAKNAAPGKPEAAQRVSSSG